MKSFAKGHRRGVRSEQVTLKRTRTPETPGLLPSTFKVPKTQPQPASDQNPLFRDATHKANLTVQLTLSFGDPLNYSYSRDYEGSPALRPTDELCEALLRRIDHCSEELITRKDSSALERTSGDGTPKPKRFEIHVRMVREKSEVWSSRTFVSYQRQPLGAEAAKEFILSTHHMVGLFLRRHDEGFAWKDGPVRDDISQEQETFPYRPGRVQPMSCVPLSYFLEKSQNFETIPGWSIRLSLTSRNNRRRPPEWHDTAEINSGQTTPLNSVGAERLFFDASYAMESIFRTERQAFEGNHHSCLGSDGCRDCRQHEGEGMELKLTISNNLGPHFDHLERTMNSGFNMFSHPQAQDCVEFLTKMRSALVQVRDSADETLSRVNDIEFRITELRGHGWALNRDEPLLFTLDPTNSYSRRSTEAFLDRVQTGVADMLKGNAIAVRMTAHKRGHFILDKTLVAREPLDTPGKKSPRKSKAYVLDRLRQRIQRDIDTICRDTLSINDRKPEAAMTNKPDEPLGNSPALGTPCARSSPKGLADTSSRSPDRPLTPQQSPPTRYRAEERQAEETYSSSSARSPTMKRRRAPVIYDPVTGARSFPLGRDIRDQSSRSSSSCCSSSGDDNDEGELQRRVFKLPIREHGMAMSPPRTVSVSSTGIGTQDTQPSGPPTVADDKSNQESDRAYEPSTASTAPSLVFGGSPRSSLLATPKVYGSVPSTELDSYRHAATDSDAEDGKETETIGDDGQRKSSRTLPLSPPTFRLASRRPGSSPLHQDQTAREHSTIDIRAADTSGSEGSTLVKEDPEQNAFSRVEKTVAEEPMQLASGIDLEEETPPVSHSVPSLSTYEPSATDQVTNEHEAFYQLSDDEIAGTSCLEPLGSIVPEVRDPEPVGFSQSKLDFAFSSPPTATPAGSLAADRSPTSEFFELASPDPSEDYDFSDLSQSPRTRFALMAQRKSFGSAGYLGFHEPRFGEVGLRALIRSPPRSVVGDSE
ncbi:Uu.00g046060.m01.CDS01 [Anthostomella pinea]|uniref:Uu.00g046060.m01.CDS01 n=1 Tax=Anthostomella pinea TaxID=933095 RepID=A0AAI8YEL4_9PEZI|nr:Uu.00g046060.m01.CDS01 [Anthostomella pinea]